MEEPELLVADAEAWRRWLEEHHAQAGAIWVVLAKKGTLEPTNLTFAEALDEALCHGWIDGQVRRRDEMTYRQRFTRRRERSNWSPSNIAHIDRLTAAGRMHPAGLAAVERAKVNGTWTPS